MFHTSAWRIRGWWLRAHGHADVWWRRGLRDHASGGQHAGSGKGRHWKILKCYDVTLLNFSYWRIVYVIIFVKRRHYAEILFSNIMLCWCNKTVVQFKLWYNNSSTLWSVSDALLKSADILTSFSYVPYSSYVDV